MGARIPRLAALGLAAAAAAALAAAAPAGAESLAAAAPDGGAHFAWFTPGAGGQVEERSLSGGGTLSGIQSVSWARRSVYSSQVAVDAAGNAVMAWLDNAEPQFRAYARRRTADGGLTPIQLLSPDGVSVGNLRLAVEPDGDAVAVWARQLNGKVVIQARRRTAAGGLGQVVTLSSAGGDSRAPEVAVAPDGTATVAWVRDAPDERFVQTRTLRPDGTLTQLQRLSGASDAITNLSVAVEPGGRAVAAWARRVDAGTALETRARSATGALAAVQVVAPAAEYAGHATMAGNAEGRAVYAWSRQAGDGLTVRGRVRRPDGTLGPAFDVSDGPGQEPRVAVDADGDAWFAYRSAGTMLLIHARRRTVAGGLGAQRMLSDPADNGYSVQLAVDPAGKATVAWYAVGQWQARTITPSGTASDHHQISED
ncbi:MAG TPA: hypothetical protein VF533_12425 [Solirubrobacteraceae bacterium]